MTPETELAMLCGFGRQGNAGIADPSQDKERFFRYRDEAIQAVKDITKVYPNETQRGEIAALSAQPDFDFDLWQQSIRSCEMSKVKPGNVSCYIDTYRAGGDYAKMCRQRQNGGKGTTVVPIDPAPSHTLPDLSPDPLVSWWRLQLTMLNPAWKAATPVSKENGKLVVRIDQPGPRAHLSLPDRLQAALLALDGVEELEVIP